MKKIIAAAVAAPGVALACLQHANHEVGTVQPLATAHGATRRAGVPLLVDACASLGSLPAPADWDVLAGSAHKWGGHCDIGTQNSEFRIQNSWARPASSWPA